MMLTRLLFVCLISAGCLTSMGQDRIPQKHAMHVNGKWNAGPIELLQSRSVINALGLQPMQKERLREWSERWSFEILLEAERRVDETLRLGQVEQVNDVLQQLRMERIASAYASLEGVICDAQINRLKQIDAQVSGLDTFVRLELSQSLALTEEQSDLHRQLTQDLREQLSDLRIRYGLTQSTPISQEKLVTFESERRELHDAALIKFLRALSKEQRIAYNEICGVVINVKWIRHELTRVSNAV